MRYPLLCLLLVLPILAVPVPGLGDYLNHLARMHVLASIATSPDLQRFYSVHWAPIPYLAMDAIVPLLARFLPIYLAGKLFMLACVLLPVAGASALHHALYRRASAVPLLACLLSYNYLLSLGFLNFLFSAGCAVLLFAGWVATEAWPRWPRAAMFAPLVTLLYFGHAFACAGYCLAVAGWEIGFYARARLRPLGAMLADATAALAQAAPALYFAATLDLHSDYVGPLHTRYGDLADKLAAFAAPILFQADPVNILVLMVVGALGLAFAWWLRVDSRLWPAALLVALAALGVPHLLASTWGTDLRLPLIAALLLIGGLSTRRLSAFWRNCGLAAVIFLVAVKSADAWAILRRADHGITETRTVLAHLPRGARLLVVNVARGLPAGAAGPSPSTQWHMPLVAVIEHDAFVPYLFTGLSTVHVRAPFRDASTPNGFPITPKQLWSGLAASDIPGHDVPDGIGGGRLYALGWPAKFDFVLVQMFGHDPGKLPDDLKLVAFDADMALFRIVKAQP